MLKQNNKSHNLLNILSKTKSTTPNNKESVNLLRYINVAEKGCNSVLNRYSEKFLTPIESTSLIHLVNSIHNKGLQFITIWIHGIFSGTVSIVSAILKMIAGIIGSSLDVIISLIASGISLSIKPFTKGLIQLSHSIAGGIISIVGNTLVLIVRVLGLLTEGRLLRVEEKVCLQEVFHESLDTKKIRIAYFPFLDTYFFALHNTIYSPHKDLSIPPYLLVHESVHVWQYHHEGTTYLAEALLAQMQYGIKNIPGNAYDWTAEISRGKTDWRNFNKEAAAQMIEEIWKEGESCILIKEAEPLEVEYGCGVFFRISAEDYNRKPRFISKRDHQDYTDLAIESILKLRSIM